MLHRKWQVRREGDMTDADTGAPQSRQYRCGVYGVGRIGRVHAATVTDAGEMTRRSHRRGGVA
jgi:hypothetical protein